MSCAQLQTLEKEMTFVRNLKEEAGRRNYHIYNQWILIFVAMLSSASLIAATSTLSAGRLQKEDVIPAIYILVVQVVTLGISIMLIHPFFNISDQCSNYDARMFIGLGMTIPNLGCLLLRRWWPSLVIALLLIFAFVMHAIAHVKCQPMVVSRLAGGDGEEEMVLYVRGRSSLEDWWRRKRERTRFN